VYRGIYDWDGADSAERFVRSLWRVLALVCEPTSINFRILQGLRRDELLSDPRVIASSTPDAMSAWWRPVTVT
jgi:hypothetical protein